MGLIDRKVTPPYRAGLTSDTIRPYIFGDINSSHMDSNTLSYTKSFRTALVERISKLTVLDADMDPFRGFAFHKPGQQFFVKPWYPGKSTPSFADALNCLRRLLWRDRIKFMFGKKFVHNKKFEFLIEALAAEA